MSCGWIRTFFTQRKKGPAGQVCSGVILKFSKILPDYLLAGASAIQIGTANFYNPNVYLDVLEGIKDYMKVQGFQKIEDFDKIQAFEPVRVPAVFFVGGGD